MNHSIYVKNILNYFFVMVVTVIASYFITSLFFGEEQAQDREKMLMSLGNQIIVSHQRLDKSDFNEYIDGLSMIPIRVYLYDETGLIYQNSMELQEKKLSTATIDQVLKGGDYSSSDLVGIPFEMNGHPFALFLNSNIVVQSEPTQEILLVSLLLTLILGIFLISWTTRLLVKPINKITSATRELAKGNFNVKMDIKSNDEIGELAESFQFMAKEIQKTEQLRRDFVANVSHEFQSPLTAIRGMVGAIKDDVVDPKEVKRYLELIEQESERLSNLTKEMLNLTALESNRDTLHAEKYRLDRQMRDLFVSMQPLWMEKEIDVDFDLPKMELWADPDLMSQVWTNLFSNAIKYNVDGGKITVTALDMGDELYIEISNTGPGIPEKDLPYIYERFYRVDKAHQRTTNSYGLGLAVVKRVIQLHGGSIHAESLEGKKTVFHVILHKTKNKPD